MAVENKAIKHLHSDKKLKPIIQKVGSIKLKKDNNLFIALLRAIVGQQLSTKAANTIWLRFAALFGNEEPNAEKILKMNDELLRSVGLSYQKAGYIKNIATFSIEKTLDYNELKKMEDEELINYLCSIKGVGRWTVEMILMFSLNRKDIFPVGDLGIQNGMKMIYNLKTEKKELFNQMHKIAESWKPYRSVACMYVWRYKDSL